MSLAVELDIETYSAAGFLWNEEAGKWEGPKAAPKAGLSAVGSAVYAEHPTTEVLMASFTRPDGYLERWLPGQPCPESLRRHVEGGGLIVAHKALFERFHWDHVLVPKHAFPPMRPEQWRCSMATAHVQGWPGDLATLGEVLGLDAKKDARGKALIKKFSVPQNPTKKDPRLRIYPQDDPVAFSEFQSYCDRDVETERAALQKMEPMTEAETEFWLIDQEINYHGIQLDLAAIENCIAIIEQVETRYGEECRALCGAPPSGLPTIKAWLAEKHGVFLPCMDQEAIEEALLDPAMPEEARRVLEIRALTGSASIKKLYAMRRQACRDGRVRDTMVHHKARTGRPGGEGVQPLNMPKAGPKVRWCNACKRPFNHASSYCRWCLSADVGAPKKWSSDCVEPVLHAASWRSLDALQWIIGDAVQAIVGCLRGMFIAGPGMEFISADYSAIEAVVIACLAGEQWRIDAFKNGDPIYLLSASKITGVPLQTYLDHNALHNEHHPDRGNIGKVAELGLGFGGWINAWLQFDDSGRYSEAEIKRFILAWRAESPAIIEMWGGQFRGRPWEAHHRQEYFGVEGAAVQAILHPGEVFDFRGLKFYMRGSALKIRLLSGRELTYQRARLVWSTRAHAAPGEYAIIYETMNTNPKMGSKGWVVMSTFGGRLTENIVQATAHDILRFAILNLWRAGYRTVLPIYDEIVAEVLKGSSDKALFGSIMCLLPHYAAGWPIRIGGVNVAHRFSKED